VANFTIKGDCDEVTAQLKAKLEANDAQFNAQLDAIFKSTPAAKQEPAAAAPAPPSNSTSGWGDTTSRKPPNGGSMHSRLRG
jgi:prephenate dehydrogenase